MKLHELKFDLVSILEGISAANDRVVFSTTSWREASTKDTISTSFKRIPYKTSIKGSDPIYSILNYISSDQTTKLLTSLKGKGPYQVNDKILDQFLTGVVGASKKIIDHLDPTVIIYPKSSSDLLKKFVEKLKSAYPNIKVADEAFIKTVLKAGDEEAMINTAHPDWKKFAEENPEAVSDLKKSLARNIKDGNLELKKLYKPYTKFIKNFVELKDAYQTLEQVMGQKVIVVDDILSSGTTMLEMFRQLKEFEPELIAGLTIFKRTSDSTT
jgi:hypothetical protein